MKASVGLNTIAGLEFLETSPAGPSGDLWSSQAVVPVFIPLGDDWRLTASMSGKVTDYGEVPYDDHGLSLWNLGAYVGVSRVLGGPWSVNLNTFSGSSFEDTKDFDDALNGGLALGFGYRWSPSFNASLGIMYLYRSYGNPLVLPAVRVDWRICEQLKFSVNGLKADLTYRVSKPLDLSLAAQYSPGGGILKERDVTEARRFEDTSFGTLLGVGWHATEQMTFSLQGGLNFHHITLSDEDDHTLTEDHLDPSASVMASAEWKF